MKLKAAIAEAEKNYPKDAEKKRLAERKLKKWYQKQEESDRVQTALRSVRKDHGCHLLGEAPKCHEGELRNGPKRLL